jgi:hypothetical protein
MKSSRNDQYGSADDKISKDDSDCQAENNEKGTTIFHLSPNGIVRDMGASQQE